MSAPRSRFWLWFWIVALMCECDTNNAKRRDLERRVRALELERAR